MNTFPRTAYVEAICRETYKGVDLYETGEGVVILIGHEYRLFKDAKEAKQHIDECTNAIVQE